MRKIVLVLLIALCARVFAQSGAGYYVSANGNDNNDGLSENTPFKTLDLAIFSVRLTGANKITVIGTLTIENSEFEKGDDTVFFLIGSDGGGELLITGKPGISGAERAVLSGRGSGAIAAWVLLGNVRFEHIEISGGEGEDAVGLIISSGAKVSLGPGAVVLGNQSFGVYISEGTCAIDGGEVRDNAATGVAVGGKGILTMRGGSIRDNRSPNNAGGVFVAEGGIFTMYGGTVSGNSAVQAGGGVVVRSGGRFDQIGGTVSGNSAPQSPDVSRSSGSLGSDLVTR